jgi:hypothetical protein
MNTSPCTLSVTAQADDGETMDEFSFDSPLAALDHVAATLASPGPNAGPARHFELSVDDGTAVTLLVGSGQAHLGIWVEEENPCYPVTEGADDEVKVGWKTIPGKYVLADAALAVESARYFYRNARLDPSMTWDCEY